jgi:hypothetical protein
MDLCELNFDYSQSMYISVMICHQQKCGNAPAVPTIKTLAPVSELVELFLSPSLPVRDSLQSHGFLLMKVAEKKPL